MKNQRVFGNASGITLLKENIATVGRGSTARISNLFNTGWMSSDIRRTYLSDIDTGSVGAELVTNGTFDTDISGWSVSPGQNAGTISWDASGAISLNASGGFIGAETSIATVIGKRYYVSFTVTSSQNPANSGFRISPNNNSSYNSLFGYSAVGTYYGSFVATATTTWIQLLAHSATTTTVLIDNVSIKLCAEDRSYKSSLAPITGTLTKTAVAPGAQLVAYSGFSS